MNRKKVLLITVIFILFIVIGVFFIKNKFNDSLNRENVNIDNPMENTVIQDENEGSVTNNEKTRKEELIKKYESKMDRKNVEEISKKIKKYPNKENYILKEQNCI